jgi:hypothetical protein
MGWEQRCVSTVVCPAKPVLENDMRMFLTCLIGAAGLTIAGFGPPAAAESLKSVVGTLNAIVNPEDAWRLEDQARRYRRQDDAGYWRNYGEGLEQQRRERGGPEPQHRDGRRYSGQIDPDEAYRLEDQARRFGRPKVEQYWGRYREGLDNR